MNTRLMNTAAGVLHAAMEQGTATAAGLAFALEAAQLLQSPESAAEVARLRTLTNADPAELSEVQIDALADAGNRALNDHYHDDLCHCSDWPESCASSGNYFAGSWDTAAFSIGMAAVIGAWESMRAPAEAAELSRLRAQVTELEAERAPKQCGRELSTGQPCPDHPRPAEPHREGPERHAYRISHDLPEYPVSRLEDQ